MRRKCGRMGEMLSFKKIFVVLLFLVVLGLGLSADWGPREPRIKSGVSEGPEFNSGLGGQIRDLRVGNSVVRVVWVEVDDPQKVALYPNFAEQQSAEELFRERRCSSLVNGGFYGKDEQPIGLFVSEGELLGEKIADDFFNGFLVVDRGGVVLLDDDVAGGDVRIALQSGPWLIRNGNVHQISVRGDKFARRMVVALTPEGSLVFLAVFDSQNSLSGPKLADLPAILLQFAQRSNLKFKDALNLDGGSASAFLTPKIQITERNPIGSFFCAREF